MVNITPEVIIKTVKLLESMEPKGSIPAFCYKIYDKWKVVDDCPEDSVVFCHNWCEQANIWENKVKPLLEKISNCY